MNTDIRDIPKLVQIKDPRSLWAVMGLVVAIVLPGIVSRLLVTSIIERVLVQGDLDVARAHIVQIQGMQGTNPDALWRRIAERRQELGEASAGLATAQQADDEIGRHRQYTSHFGASRTHVGHAGYAGGGGAASPAGATLPAGRAGRDAPVAAPLGPHQQRPLHGADHRQHGQSARRRRRGRHRQCRPDGVCLGARIRLGSLPDQAAPAPTATLGQTDNTSEIEAAMRRAVADQDWAGAVAHGRRILQLDPDRQDIVRALETPTPAPAAYGLRPGVTLSAIAACHGATAPALVEANASSGLTIDARQRLVIPRLGRRAERREGAP